MKPPLPKLLCGVALLFVTATPAAAQSDGHVLAKKGRAIWSSLPAGKWLLESSTIQKDINAVFEGAAGKETSLYTQEDASQIRLEKTSESEMRATLVKHESKSSALDQGKPVSKTGPPSPIVGLPFFIEKKEDGSFRTGLETGTATPEQTELIESISKLLTTEDFVGLYGETPRKTGEKWPVSVKLILGLLPPLKDATGTAEVEFVKIEEFRGSRCAVIRLPFKVSGIWQLKSGMPPADSTFEGEVTTYRSLAGLVDLESKVEVKMVAVSKKEGAGTATLSGPISSTKRLVLEKR